MLQRAACLVLSIGVLFAASCSTAPTQPASRALTVFAAASLLDAFTEIGHAYEAANPGASVVFNFDGSQSLRTQIEQGAVADVFASANQKEMDALISQSLISNNRSQTFVANNLVVILPANNPAGIGSLNDLARPGLKLVLAAAEVPVGRYARESLAKLNAQFGPEFSSQVLGNVASSEDNVKQIVAKVQLGEADAGIVYGSDAVAAPDLATIDIPPEYNVVADYPIAVLAHAPQPDLAAQFIRYVLSPDGQAMLEKWGFKPAASD